MAAVFEPDIRITSVHIEGLALLKIVKHCHESLPQMVTGSLLGLALENGILEVTHAFPFPSDNNNNKGAAAAATSDADNDGLEGHEFQLEMMRMLREVNVDNNCVGWYQSMYLGIYSTTSLLDNQLSYQTDLSPNAVVILYDPMQTTRGQMVLKCYRLTDECVKLRASGRNAYIEPQNIFEDIPIRLTNPGLARALLTDISDGLYDDPTTAGYHAGLYDINADTSLDRLDLSTNPYLEKHLELLSGWVEDLASEQQKFQYYSRQLARGASGDNRGGKNKRGVAAAVATNSDPDGDAWASSDAPRRLESLLIANQIRSYCDQMDTFSSGGLSKLYMAAGLHGDNDKKSSTLPLSDK